MLKLSALILFVATSLVAQVTVFQNARVIDGSGRPAMENTTLVVAGGKIRSVGAPHDSKMTDSARVIDLDGKTVIPGIINLHGHVGMTNGLVQHPDNYTRENVEANLLTYAHYGVTTTTSLGVDLDLIVRIRAEQERGLFTGARVFTALQGFTTRAGYPTHVPGVKGVAQEVSSAAQARHWVDRLAQKGANAVKMWVDDYHDTFKKLPPNICEAIIKQARRKRLKSFAHIYELEDAKRLVRSGLDVLAHSVRDQEIDQDFISLLKKNDTTVVATLTREKSTYIYADSPLWIDEVFFTESTTPAVLQELKSVVKERQNKDPNRNLNRQNFEIAKRNLKILSDGGVRIGFGTDTGPPGRFPGFFEHWEMQLMVEAGLTPMQVITSFSRSASEALGVDNNLGVLARGKSADFIVLNRNPLLDIRNTQAIHSVYLRGTKVR